MYQGLCRHSLISAISNSGKSQIGKEKKFGFLQHVLLLLNFHPNEVCVISIFFSGKKLVEILLLIITFNFTCP
jgi:hypothetical protein